ncbi:MAG: hypothetical protein J1E40_05360 [Oscillospiraceae bacterium]|nr:hypothetical protein [Oscillospiraceae bacterium]
MKADFLFKKGFKFFMKLVFLTALILNAVNRYYSVSFSDFAHGFIDGIEIVLMIAWIFYVVVCAANRENPFRDKEG